MFEKMSFSEGLAFAAERLINNHLRKEAGDPVDAAQSARAQLGILGVPQAGLNDIVSKHRKGELTDWQAGNQFSGLIPGIGTQIGNIPNAVGVAAGQGRIGDVLGQADVAGWKNLNPFSAPITSTLAVGTGLGTHALASRYHYVKDLKDLIRGTTATDHLMAAIGDSGSKDQINLNKDLLDRHRALHIEPHVPIDERIKNWFNNKNPSKTPVLQRLTNAVKDRMLVPQEIAVPDAKVTRHHYQSAINRLYKERGKSWLPVLAGLAAGTVPLAAKEWLYPSGYRSGRNPFNTLLQTNKELNSTDERRGS